jgi:hypothetical protein
MWSRVPLSDDPVLAFDGEEIWIGDSLVVFDGRVLEVFGFRGSESLRFHVRNLDVEVAEPDRKGRRLLTLRPASRGSGGCAFEVSPEDWAAAESLLARVFSAMPE